MTKPKIRLNFDQRQAPLNDLYGLFFEDLNHAADGGLYAELIQNRSFEYCEIDNADYHALYGWEQADGSPAIFQPMRLRVLNDDPLHPNNPHYLKINSLTEIVIGNRGYNDGLYLPVGESYRVTFFAKPDCQQQKVCFEIQKADGTAVTHDEIQIDQAEWTKYSFLITAAETVEQGRLAVIFPPATDLAIDMISIFPTQTFMERENGCRKDLAELLAAMKPKFLRFPGGCLVHDGSLHAADRDAMYRWKNTVGPVETRPAKRNNWGYNQSLGLGYFEYFQLCEDLGAKPIPVLPAGWDPHHQRAVPISELGPWIQDALDLIEFAMGDQTTTWGKVRAEMGHPAPFALEYLGIGNEEVGQEFFDRYDHFHQAIRAAYPHIKLINSSGPFAAGSEYDRGWQNAKANGSDLVDEHYYSSPSWFIANHHRYDTFDLNGPKVFLGEYASKANTWWNAIAEASFMIGLERNADKVGLACYAPLFANKAHVNWQPDLIWFDQKVVEPSVNYAVQKLFTRYQGTENIGWQATDFPADKLVEDAPITGGLGVKADEAEIELSPITLTDHSKGETLQVEIPVISGEDQYSVAEINSSEYTVSFSFVKTGGRWDKGFKFIFGKKDDQNLYSWELGGWQNQDCLIDAIDHGMSSVLTQSIWKVEFGKRYDCRLEVSGRKNKTYINDVLFNETENQPLIMQPAYINAVYDEGTAEYYLKLVNVQAAELAIELTNPTEGDVTVIELTAPEATATEGVVTREYPLSDTKEILLPAQSVVFVKIPANE